MLVAYLDHQRATLELKCAGITDAQLRERAVHPSGLSLLGLVRHLVDVERSWFANRFGHRDLPLVYFTDEDPNADFANLDEADTAEVFAQWRAACEVSRDVVAAAPSLDDQGVRGDATPVSLRWIILHMLVEYARHNGHADLIREAVDGSTGE